MGGKRGKRSQQDSHADASDACGPDPQLAAALEHLQTTHFDQLSLMDQQIVMHNSHQQLQAHALAQVRQVVQAANNAAMLSALNAVHGTGGAPGAVPTSQPPAVPEVNMGDAPQQDSSSAPPPIGRERSTSFKTHKEATERVRRPSSQTQVAIKNLTGEARSRALKRSASFAAGAWRERLDFFRLFIDADAKERIAHLFIVLDTHRNGYLEEEDFVLGKTLRGPSYAAQMKQWEQVCKVFDADGDKRITQDEFEVGFVLHALETARPSTMTLANPLETPIGDFLMSTIQDLNFRINEIAFELIDFIQSDGARAGATGANAAAATAYAAAAAHPASSPVGSPVMASPMQSPAKAPLQ